MLREKDVPGTSGFGAVLLAVLLLAGSWFLTTLGEAGIAAGAVIGTLAAGSLAGLYVVAPNDGRVLQFLGRYVGTVRRAGFYWAVPGIVTRRAVSLRVRNFVGDMLKVNDKEGNPIEIAAIVVWRVIDTAQAVFQVDDYQQFVRVQSESAVRSLASRYAYDAHDDAPHSLRGNTDEVTQELRKEIHERLAQAGVEVLEARFSHLAYAPEIAQAMLQRQQASAIVAARQKIVEGAVGMVEMALAMLSQKNVVELDEERKATMVSNLLVVLCGERGTQPVVNAGTLYR